jgi:hypothetical protein
MFSYYLNGSSVNAAGLKSLDIQGMAAVAVAANRIHAVLYIKYNSNIFNQGFLKN